MPEQFIPYHSNETIPNYYYLEIHSCESNNAM